MRGLLMGGRRGGSAVDFDEDEARRIVGLLDHVEARDPWFLHAGAGIGERRGLKGCDVLRFDVNLDVDDEQRHGENGMAEAGERGRGTESFSGGRRNPAVGRAVNLARAGRAPYGFFAFCDAKIHPDCIMKNRFLTFVLAGSITLAGVGLAQTPGGKAPAPKTPADLAFDAFNKERGAPGTRDQARFKKVIDAGMEFLAAHATHWRVNEVVNGLAFYPNSIDKKEAPLRVSYLSNLKLEVTNLKYKDGASDAAKAAAVAVDAAIADFEVRDAFSPAGLVNYREKIDALNETTGAGRFLVERERSYAQMLAFTAPPRAEALLKAMLTHKDKGVAGMARTELNLLEAKKVPFALSFTGFDGKPTDLAQLRGKVVALYIWSSTNKGSLGNFEGLKRIHSDYRKKGFEVVTVSFDKEEDRAKVAAAIKEARIAWPVHFDGKGAKNDWAAKLNITGVPALLLIDQKGMLQHTMQGSNLTINLPLNQLEGQVKRMLGVK